MMELESYLAGEWVKGTGRPATLFNPATAEPIATTSTQGIDFGRALDFARNVGGPALRAKTFIERGEILRAMSRAIHQRRDELIALAIKNGGNTRSDAKFDIDGATGTLAAYADLAAELGDTPVVVDGDGISLGRSARLYGQHVFVPREGVAVHVNAFNFPAWGLAEKAACALLAGMPVLSKPATSTALVAHRIVEILVKDEVLPPGTLSFVAGSAGDLLSKLRGQDVLAFTGSSATGVLLRGDKNLLAHSVRMNVEADSLNAAILGPDVDAGELFDLFVADVVRDMTQKTGQKCTAIRRVYVPSQKVDGVIERLRERLLAIKVGDPAQDSVGMGPVATADQRADVRSGIEKLASVASVVVRGEAPEGPGYFVPVTLLRASGLQEGDPVHTHEVFGPVATVIPYDGTPGQAARAVGWGAGGLVSSIYSDDKAFVRDAVLGMAPFNGRITLGSSKVASQAIPPGTVLPQLVHGGPGRAGAGEELGGRRGLAFYMQRLALQGDRAIVELFTGKRG